MKCSKHVDPCACGCGGSFVPTFNASKQKRTRPRNPLRRDPARISSLQSQFLAETNRRFNWLWREIYQLVVTEDAFGLAPKQNGIRLNVSEEEQNRRNRRRRLREQAARLAAKKIVPGGKSLPRSPEGQPRRFEFLTNDQKAKQFKRWLEDKIEVGLLEGGEDNGWGDKYVDSAYRKGLVRSYLEARGLNANDGGQGEFLQSSFAAPERASKLKILYSRQYDGLEGITSSMSSKIGRTFAQGLLDGIHPHEVARRLQKDMDMPRARARTLARTEMMHAHAEGQLDGFEDLGVQEVGADVEWSTAGDDRVCPICAAMNGTIYTISEARGLIPMHPNCRCVWIPSESMASAKKPGSESKPKKTPARETAEAEA